MSRIGDSKQLYCISILSQVLKPTYKYYKTVNSDIVELNRLASPDIVELNRLANPDIVELIPLLYTIAGTF